LCDVLHPLLRLVFRRGEKIGDALGTIVANVMATQRLPWGSNCTIFSINMKVNQP
jgi:hypothetical protein